MLKRLLAIFVCGVVFSGSAACALVRHGDEGRNPPVAEKTGQAPPAESGRTAHPKTDSGLNVEGAGPGTPLYYAILLVDAPPGTYKNAAGGTVMQKNAQGRYTTASGELVMWTIGDGFYRGISGNTIMWTIGDGFYRDNAGNTIMWTIGDGFYRDNAGNTIMWTIGDGFYRDNAGNTIMWK